MSTRHLSYVETGRSAPSREMVLRLAERLAVPLRERNALLVAAGYAPMYRERPLDDPALAAARRAVELVLKGHEPYPALAIDRHWNLVAHNAPVPLLMAGAAAALLAPPINVLRLSLHPQGLAPRIANLGAVARAPAGAPAAASRRHRRCRAAGAARRTGGLPRRPGRRRGGRRRAGRQRVGRPGGPAAAAHARWHAELHQHHHHLRHAGRRHFAGTGGGVLVSGGCGDGAGAGGAGGRSSAGARLRSGAGASACGGHATSSTWITLSAACR